MKKRYMAGLMALLLTAASVVAPVTVNAKVNELTGSLQRDGIEIGEAAAGEISEPAGDVVNANPVSGNDILLGTESVYSYSGALNRSKPSKSSIAAALTNIYFAEYSLLDEKPSTSGSYSLGAVSAAHRQKGLESVNLMRNIAGLPEVYLSDSYNQLTQYGAVVLAANDTLTHTPSQPAGMDASFYQNGYTATTQSNIAYGWSSSGNYNLPLFTLGYMDDSGSSNVTSVGHRRWILNPSMKYTGFGYAVNDRNAAYSAMYAFNKEAEAPDYDFISWPASGNFPSELGNMEMPWHVTLNPNKFDISKINTNDVTVKITAPDGATQTISSADTAGSAADQATAYYTINKQGYGVANAIIFRPGTSVFGSGDLDGVYNVTITGLYEKDGTPAIVSYNIEFYEALSYDNGTNNEAANDGQITAFVQRLYSICFDREADDGGLIYWKTSLANRTRTGAATAYGFFFSDEMNNRNLNDSDFVEMLYRVMMDRASDADGKTYWLARLSAGVSREGVFKGFAESTEFTNICNAYGITRGNVTVSQGRDRNSGATMFVSRLYTKALGRDYDIDGLNDWCNRICDGTWSVTDVATTGFFDSQEFLNKNLSNEEYVKVLYRTFLDREYDDEGLADWLGQLNSGTKTREEVLRGFSYSREFSNMMKEYGL